MMWQGSRALEIFRQQGLISLIKKSITYTIPVDYYNNDIWPLLPIVSGYGTYNGVEVKGTHPMKIRDHTGLEIKHRVLDNIVPWHTPSKIPNFKEPNINQIHKN